MASITDVDINQKSRNYKKGIMLEIPSNLHKLKMYSFHKKRWIPRIN